MPVKFTTQPSSNFWKFWTGQTISNLGSSFTGFALPLLIFKLTHSPLNLAFTSVLYILPHLLFGLFIGTWVDRVDRKRLMFFTDIVRAFVIALLPLLALTNQLTVWWIYAATFVIATLSIFFEISEFAAISSLVSQDNLVKANGHIQASYSAATVLIELLPLPQLLFIDAFSFLVSAVSLLLISTSFNTNSNQHTTNGPQAMSLLTDMRDGMHYVWNDALLRNIVLLLTLTNFLIITPTVQLIAFAKQQIHTSDAQLSWLYAAGGIGVIIFSLLSYRFQQRFSFRKVALGSLMLSGLMVLCMAFTPWYWMILPLWALFSGLGAFFNIIIYSLVQVIVPDNLLGRAIGFGRTIAWISVPLGTIVGGIAIEQTRSIVLVYTTIGVLTILIPLAFLFIIKSRLEDYLHADGTVQATKSDMAID